MSRKTTANRISSPTVPLNYRPTPEEKDKLARTTGYNLPQTKAEGGYYAPKPRLDGSGVPIGSKGRRY